MRPSIKVESRVGIYKVREELRRFRHKVSRIEGVKPVMRYKLLIIDTLKYLY
jgi:hypothetical protein